MSYSKHMILAATLATGALSATCAFAQERFYERVGNWTVVGASTFCTVPGGAPEPFPDGKMPPWDSITLKMATLGSLEIRYGGEIAANAKNGPQEGQALIGDEGEQPDYFRPRMIVADQPGGGRQVTAYLEGEALDAFWTHDYFVLRAGDQMLPMTPGLERQALGETIRRCVEGL